MNNDRNRYHIMSEKGHKLNNLRPRIKQVIYKSIRIIMLVYYTKLNRYGYKFDKQNKKILHLA